MTCPIITIPSVEDAGFMAFFAGRRAYQPYGFAFCPYDCGSTLHANWLAGYARAFNAVSST